MSFKARVLTIKSAFNPRTQVTDWDDDGEWVCCDPNIAPDYDDEPVDDIPDLLFDFNTALLSACTIALQIRAEFLKAGVTESVCDETAMTILDNVLLCWAERLND